MPRNRRNPDPYGGAQTPSQSTRLHNGNKHNLDPGGGKVQRHFSSNNHNLDRGGGAKKESFRTWAHKNSNPGSFKGVTASSPFSRQGLTNASNQRNYDPKQGNREWANHKYIDKVKTKSGKIRYIYDPQTGNIKRENVNRTLEASAKKAGQRNTGKPESMKGWRGMANQAARAASGLASDAYRGARKAGSDFCKAAGDLWGSTPLSKLFG